MDKYTKDVKTWDGHWKNSSLLTIDELMLRCKNRVDHALQFVHSKSPYMIDLGSGDGKVVFYLAHLGYKSAGVDFAKETVTFCKRLAKTRRWQIPPQFYCENIISTPFENETFDVCFSFGVLEHFRDFKGADSAIHESYRILKPGGILYATVPNLWSPFGIGSCISSALGIRDIWQRPMSSTALKNLIKKYFKIEYLFSHLVEVGFVRAFRLNQKAVKKVIPNPFYPMRNILIRLSNWLDTNYPQFGYENVIVAKKL